MPELFQIQLSFKGTTVPIEVSTETSADELVTLALSALPVDEKSQLKLLWKGKRLEGSKVPFSSPPAKTPKIMVLATEATEVHDLNARRSDPTIRGFDQERKPSVAQNVYWGPNTAQDKNYKFCRFQSCSWQSFGHRPHSTTPHDFEARQLLERMATDPGIVAVLKERELVVGTLGEMDPIDDRLMQKKSQEGACLLGYNTNAGARIDVKLRTDDLRGFRPYPQLVATLLHELSHNWVGEHDLLFWTNYGQMRVEYLFTHTLNNQKGFVVNGKTTAQLAGLTFSFRSSRDVFEFVMQELTHEMAQHRLYPSLIESAIRQRCDELERATTVSSSFSSTGSGDTTTARRSTSGSARQMAALAAEQRRAREKQNDKAK